MRKVSFALLMLSVIIIGLLHLFTPGHLIFYHDMYRRLSYFPITLGGIWFGVRGGLILAVMTSFAFIPHIVLFISHGPQAYLSELTEILLYLSAGLLIGLIAGKEARMREKYKKTAEKLKKSYSRLQNQAQLLIRSEEQLLASQKLSTLGKLSASIAHEIKNPLSSIKGTAEILFDEFAPDHPKREFADILVAEINRLTKAVDKVLRFSPVNRSGKKDTSPEYLSSVLKRVLKLLRTHLEKKKIVIKQKGYESAKDFLVPGQEISQVLINVILNSVDAVKSGGVIFIQTEKTHEGFMVIIRDNGPGIPFEKRARIFEPFFTSKEDGTGLGLPISHRIMEGIGGGISLCDKGKEGACFAILIPETRTVNIDNL